MQNILITRQPDQAVDFVNLLSINDCKPFILPMIETIPVPHKIKTSNYDYIVFTSMNAVRYFIKYYGKYTFKKVIAIGEKTSLYLKQFNIKADIIPKIFSAKGIIEILEHQLLNSKTFFIPGPRSRSELLSNFLIEQGAMVDEPIIYETKPVLYKKNEIELFLKKNMIDIITFASPSAAEAFLSQIEIIPDNIKFVSIGTTTFDYLQERGINSIFPNDFTVEGMVEIISKKYKD